MSEPIADERLAEIHGAAWIDNEPGTFTHFLSLALREALAEVERLRIVESRYRRRLERDASAQRVAWRRKHPDARPEPQPLQPCGTNAAYQRHRRNGEDACEACARASQEYHAAQRAKRKATAP